MNVGEWVGLAVGVVTLGGFVFAGWKDGRETKQALLGYGGKGGMIEDIAGIKQELAEIRDYIVAEAAQLRTEIADSRHLLRSEVQAKLSQLELNVTGRVDGLDQRVRDLELNRRTA